MFECEDYMGKLAQYYKKYLYLNKIRDWERSLCYNKIEGVENVQFSRANFHKTMNNHTFDSYILSNGFVFLADEDVEACFDEALVSCDPDKLPQVE